MKLKRLDEPVPSPDGKWVVFSATDVDLEANTKNSRLWIVPASGRNGYFHNQLAPPRHSRTEASCSHARSHRYKIQSAVRRAGGPHANRSPRQARKDLDQVLIAKSGVPPDG
jgi:hypothetical protein